MRKEIIDGHQTLIMNDYDKIDVMVDKLGLVNVEVINNEIFGVSNFISANPGLHESFRGRYRKQMINTLKAFAMIDQASFEFGSQVAILHEIIKEIKEGSYRD